MKKVILSTFLAAAGFFNAQIKFEKGYFINNSGKKTEVLIKNIGWKNNPTEFTYKDLGSEDVKKEKISNVQEFGIENTERYIRKTVMLDSSPNQLDNLSNDRKPEFSEKTVFLKYILDGKADLLYYENENTNKFFFSIDDSEPKQLVYKPYFVNNGQVAYNDDYKNQIAEILDCGVDNKKIEAAKYQIKDLSNLFSNYNLCKAGNNIENKYSAAQKEGETFHLNIRPGINFSSLEATGSSSFSSRTTKFDGKSSFRIGLEAEFTLPFNKNKWSLFAEPTYQYYKAENESSIYPEQQYSDLKYSNSIDYKSIEIPIGIRYYIFLNDKSKIFFNAAFVLDLPLSSTLNVYSTDNKITSGSNLAVGAGYKYNDKFLIEIRVATQRDLVKESSYLSTKYQTASLILGYTLF
ncbi:porin family protein [Chryseobacterium cheonjiense]|uniref:PorT family protein n=1 Tax=Chryseobacterium cheonjiense TaxID=2728845 RepID=A0A7Y0FHF9_9FLAO|nr:porin family protein [Chryseobacterium cheonjiense]NML56215.1 PorT family protein [Chryseobacterium cheonjiense]